MHVFPGKEDTDGRDLLRGRRIESGKRLPRQETTDTQEGMAPPRPLITPALFSRRTPPDREKRELLG
jgi:hypothetical protein